MNRSAMVASYAAKVQRVAPATVTHGQQPVKTQLARYPQPLPHAANTSSDPDDEEPEDRAYHL